jgi:hypothetical protein
MTPDRPPSPELLSFLDAYDAAIVTLAMGLRDLVLDEAPEANEVVYDGAYTVAIHYTATSRYQDAFCYIALFTSHVNLGFNRGAELPDPKKKLEGAGSQMRHIKIKHADDLERPELRAFVRAALKHADYKNVVKQAGDEMSRTIVKRFAGEKKRPGRS